MPENLKPKNPKEIDVFNRFSKFNKLKIILIAFGITAIVSVILFFLVKSFTDYTITYVTYGGTVYGEELGVDEYKFLQRTRKPEGLKKEGFYIEGYYTDSGFSNEYKFGRPIWKSRTIYVNWQPGYAVQLFFAEGEDDDDRIAVDKTGINEANLKLYHEQYVKPGSTYSLPLIYNTTENNKHNGEQLLWYDTPNPTIDDDPIETEDFVMNDNIPLYGVWFDTSPSKFNITEDGTLMRYLGDCYNIVLPSSVRRFKNITTFETGIWNTGNVVDGSKYSVFDKVLTDLNRVYINPECEQLGGYAFRDCVELEKVVFLGNKIETIPNNAFGFCESLEKLTLPSSVTTIENSAFYVVNNLTTLNGLDNVRMIGSGAFVNCHKLESIELKNITEIKPSAFSSCLRLKKIVLKSSDIVTISGYIMDNVTPAKIYVPSELVEQYKLTSIWNEYSSKILPITE